MTMDSPEVLKGGGTSDSCEENPKVKTLPSSGMDIVHPPNGKVPLPPLPLPVLPDKMLWKLLVEQLPGLWELGIGFEVTHESGVLVGIGFKDGL